MINEARYRLGEYIIIEQGSVLLTWVSHIALGTQLSGRCIIIGNILVIGPPEHKEAGYLKLEFYELSLKLPAWNKTRYSCLASSIRKINTEQSLTIDLIERLLIPKTAMEPVNIMKPGIFRLGRYKITVDGNSIISWQTIGELKTTIGGRCVIESGILFVAPKEVESNADQNRQKYFAGLKCLPQWDNTLAWSHDIYLKPCRESELPKSYAPARTPDRLKTVPEAPLLFSHHYQETQKAGVSKPKVLDRERLIRTWQRVIEWKIWGRVQPLIYKGVFLGLRIVVIVFGKIKHSYSTWPWRW